MFCAQSLEYEALDRHTDHFVCSVSEECSYHSVRKINDSRLIDGKNAIGRQFQESSKLTFGSFELCLGASALKDFMLQVPSQGFELPRAP
jgi:hypothetical protein